MSRPKYDWHGHAVRQIRKYPDKLEREGTLQSSVWGNAIKDAINETKRLPDGDRRLEAIRLRFWDNTYELYGIASRMYVSEDTIKRWTNNFVHLVGKNAGY